MNFSALFTEHFDAVVVLACLLVGYLIKHSSWFKWIANDNIPFIVTIIGAVSNMCMNGVTFENIVYGAFMGAASTGLHQSFKYFIEGSDKTDATEE